MAGPHGTEAGMGLVPYGFHVGDLSKEFVRWLELQTDEEGRGRVASIAREVGLERTYVSRLLRGQRMGQLDFATLERVARAKRCAPWEILWCVANQVADPPPPRLIPPPRTR